MKDIDKRFPEEIGGEYGNYDLAEKIHELLFGKDESMFYERYGPSFNLRDIFKYLPEQITYNGHRGDLAVTPMDISYFSIGGGWEHILVHFENIPVGGNIYDAFYKMLVWLKENNLLKNNETQN